MSAGASSSLFSCTAMAKHVFSHGNKDPMECMQKYSAWTSSFLKIEIEIGADSGENERVWSNTMCIFLEAKESAFSRSNLLRLSHVNPDLRREQSSLFWHFWRMLDVIMTWTKTYLLQGMKHVEKVNCSFTGLKTLLCVSEVSWRKNNEKKWGHIFIPV